jgi:hypothetical protein
MMKLALIINFLLTNKGVRETLYETIDYLVKRRKLKRDSDGLTDADREQLRGERYDIAEAFLKIIKNDK